jgi:hypothetical protein
VALGYAGAHAHDIDETVASRAPLGGSARCHAGRAAAAGRTVTHRARNRDEHGNFFPPAETIRDDVTRLTSLSRTRVVVATPPAALAANLRCGLRVAVVGTQEPVARFIWQ